MADGKITIQIDGDSGALESKINGLGDKISGSLGELDVSGSLEKLGENLKNSIGSALSGLAAGALSALNQLTGWNGFQSIVTDALDVGMAFENSMSNVASLQYAAGATEAQIQSLKDAAEQFGATTQFTMAECADALGYMALAGWDAEKSISALPGVLNLSAASGMGLAQASDMVTDYMSAFSKSVSDYTGEALTAAEFSDKLAFAQANSNTDVQMLDDAFKNCAANMNASGQQMDTVVSILGALANQGLKGSEAGTALSAVMRDINNKMEDGAISINGTAIAIADANGNYRDMIDIMADIENATAGMGDTQKAAALSTVFTADSIKAMNLVLNAGTDSIREFENELSYCEGSADEMAKTLNDNLEGDTKACGSAMDAVKNALYEGLEPALRSIVQTITNNVAPALLDLTKGFFEMLNGVDGAGEKVKSSLNALLQWLADSAKSVLPNILSTAVDLITKGIPDIVEGVMQIADSVLDVVASLDVGTVIQEGIKNIGDRISHSNVIFRQSAENMISGFVDALPGMIGSAFDIVEQLKQAMTQNQRSMRNQGKLLIENVLNGILDDAPKLLDMLTDVTWSISGIFSDILPEMVDTAIMLVTTFGETFAQHSDVLARNMLYFAEVLLDNLLDGLDGTAEAGAEIINFLIDGISEGLPKLLAIGTEYFGKFMENMLAEIPERIQAFAEVGSDLIQKLCEGISTGIGALLQTAGSIGENLVNAVSVLAPVLLNAGAMLFDAILTGISDNLPGLLEIGGNVVMHLLGAIVGALPKLFKTVTMMASKLLSTLTGTLPDLIQVGLDVINMLLSGIMENLPLLIGSAVTLISDFIEMILKNIPLLLDAGFQILQGLLTAIMDNLPLLAESAVSLVMQLVTAILENLPLLIDCALQLIESLVNFITENLPLLMDCAFQIIETLVNGVLMNLPQILEMSIQIIEKLAEGLLQNNALLLQSALKIIHAFVKFFTDHGKDFLSMGIQILTMLIQGLGKMLPELIAEALFLATQFLEKIKNQDWKQLGKDVISFLLVGIKSMYDLAVEGVTELIDKIWTTITETDWKTLGTNILNGIVNGLFEIGNKITEWGSWFVGLFTSEYEIQSPSKVFKREIGQYLGLGIIEGLEENLPDMAKISGNISDGFKPEFDMPDIDFEKISAQMQFAANATGLSAMPVMTTNNYYNSTAETNENDNRIQNSYGNQAQGDIIIHNEIGGREFNELILSAVQLENMRRGGVFV